MASNYIVVYDTSLSNLQKEADRLVAKGYVPSGGITTVTHMNSFSSVIENRVDYNPNGYSMKIKFMQALYKPQTNSI